MQQILNISFRQSAASMLFFNTHPFKLYFVLAFFIGVLVTGFSLLLNRCDTYSSLPLHHSLQDSSHFSSFTFPLLLFFEE